MPREWRSASSLEGKLGEPNVRMVVVHQMLRLLMAGSAVLDLDSRVSDSEVSAESLLNGAHDALRVRERLVPDHDVTAARDVLG